MEGLLMLDKQKTLWLCFIIIKNKQQIYRYTNADSQKNHLSWYSCWWLFWLYERYTQSMLHPFSKQRQCVLHYLFTSLVVSPNYVHNVDPMILLKFLFTWSVLVPDQNNTVSISYPLKNIVSLNCVNKIQIQL